METTKLTSKEYFKTLVVLHFALLAGLVSFSLISMYLISNGPFGTTDVYFSNVLMILSLILNIFGVIAGRIIYNRKISNQKEEKDLKTKMTNYRGILIIRDALLEGPAFFAVIALMLTGNYLFLAFPMLMMFFFIIWWPSKTLVIADMGLNEQEIEIINNPNAIIAEFKNSWN